ncbi:hypothetical protein ACFVQB_20610 [Paenibacillus sp. NPDC057886]
MSNEKGHERSISRVLSLVSVLESSSAVQRVISIGLGDAGEKGI